MQPIIGGGQFLKKYELQRASLIFECVRRKQREDNVAKGQLRSSREKRPGRVAIHARNWERRFGQEVLVAQCARSGVKSPRPRVS